MKYLLVAGLVLAISALAVNGAPSQSGSSAAVPNRNGAREKRGSPPQQMPMPCDPSGGPPCGPGMPPGMPPDMPPLDMGSSYADSEGASDSDGFASGGTKGKRAAQAPPAREGPDSGGNIGEEMIKPMQSMASNVESAVTAGMETMAQMGKRLGNVG